MNPLSKAKKAGNKKVGFKAAMARKEDAGNFGNLGQKRGKPGAKGSAKETKAPMHAAKVMQRAIAEMRRHKSSNGISGVNSSFSSGVGY